MRSHKKTIKEARDSFIRKYENTSWLAGGKVGVDRERSTIIVQSAKGIGRVRGLPSLFEGYRLIQEDYINPGPLDDDDATGDNPGMLLSKTSLDAQVKAYLQRFEEEAVTISEGFAAALWAEHSLTEAFRMLLEQEDDLGLGGDEEGDPGADVATDGGEDPADTEEPSGDELDSLVGDIEKGDKALEVLPVSPSIDLTKFAENVKGLVDSAEYKLDWTNPIINMAVQYVKKQYDDKTAEKLINQFSDLGYQIEIADEDELNPEKQGVGAEEDTEK